MRIVIYGLILGLLASCGSNEPKLKCEDRRLAQILFCGWSYPQGCHACVVQFTDGETEEQCMPIRSQAQRVCK